MTQSPFSKPNFCAEFDLHIPFVQLDQNRVANYISKAAQHQFGISLEEIGHKDFINLILRFPKIEGEGSQNDPQDALYEEKIWKGLSVLNTGLQSKTFWLDTKICPVYETENSNLIGYHCFFSDVTQYMQIKEELHEKDELLNTTSKLAVIGEIAGSIGHEIKNPLSIVAGAASLLQREINSQNPRLEILQSSIKKINNSIDRMVKILNSLKHIVRNTVHDEAEPVMLNEILEDTHAMVEPFLKRHEIKYSIRSENSLHKVGLLCRPGELSQVLINLIKNSIDELSSKKLEDRWINMEVTNSPTTVNIRIVDSGQGIPLEIEEKIFQPLFTTKENGLGNGLGLSLSKKIIEQHSGHISVDRTYSNTCFWIQIPAFQEIIHNLYLVKKKLNIVDQIKTGS